MGHVIVPESILTVDEKATSSGMCRAWAMSSVPMAEKATTLGPVARLGHVIEPSG